MCIALMSYNLGFHNEDTIREVGDFHFGKGTNCALIMGYIPGFAAIPAVLRFINTIEAEASPFAKIFPCVRAIFEFMGLGLLFLPLDIIVTIFRFCCSCNSNEAVDEAVIEAVAEPLVS